MSERPSAEEMLKQIVERITPAVLSIYSARDHGEIAIRFQAGDFRQAVRKEVVL